MSLNLLVLLPKSYVIFAIGIILPFINKSGKTPKALLPTVDQDRFPVPSVFITFVVSPQEATLFQFDPQAIVCTGDDLRTIVLSPNPP